MDRRSPLAEAYSLQGTVLQALSPIQLRVFPTLPSVGKMLRQISPSLHLSTLLLFLFVCFESFSQRPLGRQKPPLGAAGAGGSRAASCTEESVPASINWYWFGLVFWSTSCFQLLGPVQSTCQNILPSGDLLGSKTSPVGGLEQPWFTGVSLAGKLA